MWLRMYSAVMTGVSLIKTFEGLFASESTVCLCELQPTDSVRVIANRQSPVRRDLILFIGLSSMLLNIASGDF